MAFSNYFLARTLSDGIKAADEQIKILVEFDRIEREISVIQANWLDRLFKLRPVKTPRGLYLWGDVGRGKTWMMDLFYESLDEGIAIRYHFHEFMQYVHSELRTIKGVSEPLTLVAKKFTEKVKVICLDEFNVIDIGDAMILGRLLKALFNEGITLLTTSNKHPSELYLYGIQRDSFLPAIELMIQNCAVANLAGKVDYRRQLLETLTLYHCPLTKLADSSLGKEFEKLATESIEKDGGISIMGRKIPFRQRSGGLIWFDFDALCGPPRSQTDYISVARLHHTVFISNIPQLYANRDDRTRRFIFLMDEFYDRHVKVVISAMCEPEHLYKGDKLTFEFQRTTSRLREMQTSTYLSRAHRC
jgi:cell division protein ZapE